MNVYRHKTSVLPTPLASTLLDHSSALAKLDIQEMGLFVKVKQTAHELGNFFRILFVLINGHYTLTTNFNLKGKNRFS